MSLVYIAGLLVLTVVCAAIGSGNNSTALVATCIFFPSLIALYFSPTWVAAMVKKRPNVVSIALLNLLAGWTVFGWIGALIWAYSDPTVRAAKPEPKRSAPTKICPYCAEDVLSAAIKCRHCGSDLTAKPSGV